MVKPDSHEQPESERAEEKRVIAGFRSPLSIRRATISSLLSFVGMLALVVGCRGNASSSTPPVTVIVAKPVSQTVTDYLDFTGNTAAINSVTLVARVEGYLETLHFTDGSPVKKG